MSKLAPSRSQLLLASELGVPFFLAPCLAKSTPNDLCWQRLHAYARQGLLPPLTNPRSTSSRKISTGTYRISSPIASCTYGWRPRQQSCRTVRAQQRYSTASGGADKALRHAIPAAASLSSDSDVNIYQSGQKFDAFAVDSLQDESHPERYNDDPPETSFSYSMLVNNGLPEGDGSKPVLRTSATKYYQTRMAIFAGEKRFPFKSQRKWYRNFRAMMAPYDPRTTTQDTQEAQKILNSKEIAPPNLDSLMSKLEWRQNFFWENINKKRRQIFWIDGMLWIVRHAPSEILLALRHNLLGPLPWVAAVADAVDYSVCHALQNGRNPNGKAYIDEFLLTIRHIGDTYHKPVLYSQKTFWLLSKNLDDAQLLEFCHLARTYSLALSSYTLIQFLTVLSQRGFIKEAALLINELIRNRANLNQKPFRQAGSTFLDRAMSTPKTIAIGNEALFSMLQNGFVPNVNTFNILIHSATQNNDNAQVTRLLGLLSEKNIQLDAYTWSTLLKHARERMDLSQIERITELYDAGQIVSQDGHLLSEILSCDLQVALRKSKPDPPFDAMLQRYQQVWSLDPLWELGLLWKKSDLPTLLPQPRMQTMTVMLTAYIYFCKNDTDLRRVYYKFKNTLKDPKSKAAILWTQDYTVNAFLRKLSEKATNLDFCKSIIEDMKLDLSEAGAHPSIAKTIVKASPSVQTWSIMIFSFLRHGQIDAAKEVIRTMEKEGLEPSFVTWTTMAKGLSILGLRDDLMRLIGYLKHEKGIEIDSQLQLCIDHVNRPYLTDLRHFGHNRFPSERDRQASSPSISIDQNMAILNNMEFIEGQSVRDEAVPLPTLRSQKRSRARVPT